MWQPRVEPKEAEVRRTNLLRLGLLTVLAAGVVAGCGSGSDNEAAGTVTVTVAEEAVTETVTVEAEPAAEPAVEPSPDALLGTVALEPARQTTNGVTMSLTRLVGAPGLTQG